MQQLRYIGDQGNMLVNSEHILGPLHISLCARFLHSSVLRPYLVSNVLIRGLRDI